MVLATQDALGYTLTVIADDEKTAASNLLKEYKKMHKALWNCNPTQEQAEIFIDEISYEEITKNKVIIR
jgi:hypothetical protein